MADTRALAIAAAVAFFIAVLALVAVILLAVTLPRAIAGRVASEQARRGMAEAQRAFHDAHAVALMERTRAEVSAIVGPLHEYARQAHWNLWYLDRLRLWWQTRLGPEDLVHHLVEAFVEAEGAKHCGGADCDVDCCTCNGRTCGCQRAREIRRLVARVLLGEPAPAPAPRLPEPARPPPVRAEAPNQEQTLVSRVAPGTRSS